MTKIGILGALGRMGRTIAELAPELGANVSGGIDRDGAVLGPHADVLELAKASDVLVDFSAQRALAGNLAAATSAGCPIVIGTTGLSEEDHRAIDRAAERIAVLQAANT